jgi:hypothetical protein
MPECATSAQVGAAASVTQPLFARSALRAGWRLLSPDRLHLAAIATILIAGAYAAYRINAAKPDAMGIASQAIGAGEHSAPTAAPAAALAVESKAVEPETTPDLQARIAAAAPEAPKRANARKRPAPATATKRAAAPQPTTPEPQASVGAIPPLARSPANAPFGSPVVKPAQAPQPDPWPVMDASLARCSGDLFARILCDQQVRRRFCEGRWGEVPECTNGVINDHGQ